MKSWSVEDRESIRDQVHNKALCPSMYSSEVLGICLRAYDTLPTNQELSHQEHQVWR